MDSYKIKLILIAVNVLINIDNIHAGKLEDKLEECIGSLDEIGYEAYSVMENYFELTSRLIFVNGDIVDYEKSINEKHDKCLSQNPVPDNARACSELDDAQKCLFKESNNNWAYRYECAILTKIYENKLMNAEKWCTAYAVKETPNDVLMNEHNNGVKNEDLALKIISICKDELHANGLIFENGINNYVFLNIKFNYHIFYAKYLNQRKSKDSKILNTKEWCAENAKNTGTFIEKKKTLMNGIPDIYIYQINTTLVNVCNAVLQTKFTITEEGAIVNKKNYYLNKYKTLLSMDYVYEVMGGIPVPQWCLDN